MQNIFYRNRQLLILTLTLIVVWGLAAFLTLPRMEDPETTQRNASVTTFLPGASPERVETLITEKMEARLFELEEVSSIESTSSLGVSSVGIEIKETIRNVDPVWAKVRSKIEDVVPELPAEASDPEYEDSDVSATALIAGLTWQLDTEPNYAILGRLMNGLEDNIRAIAGTDRLEIFGKPNEEITVEISSSELARLGLTTQQLAEQIQSSDAKVSAGQFRSSANELLLEVDSELDSLERIREIPIQLGTRGQAARLGDIAVVNKGIQDPASGLAMVNGYPAVVISATVESEQRVDLWAEQARAVLAEFEANLSDGLGLSIVLDQSHYVQQRLNGVVMNLIVGSGLVTVVSLVILGWRSALIVGAALPLATLMVFGCMKSLGVPLHQISVTGIIIALGLLIDNAIVVVDEMQIRLREGMPPAAAVTSTVNHLLVPLIASTLTTVLAFVPIATSPGGTGEFIGTIGLTVILALLSSLFLSMTVIVSLTGLVSRRYTNPSTPRASRWWQDGFSNRTLTSLYDWTLAQVFRRPWLGIGLALVLPVVGFVMFGTLEEQFFPPTNRDQFQVEFVLPSQNAIAKTQTQILQARDLMRQHDAVDEVHWFMGESAPAFFYNVVGGRRNAPNYAQGIVQLNDTTHLRQTIQDLQRDLDGAFPDAQVLVKQLEQGPPFAAPIELELYGADMAQLRQIGNELRGELAQVPDVIHTQSDLTESLPKLALTIDEVQARQVGLDNSAIALQLNSSLEGSVGGSVLEGTEDIPVRVRLSDQRRGDLGEISALDLVASGGETLPLDAIADVSLVPDLAQITRKDGQRINIVQGFITAGALPDTVLGEFEQRLADIGYTLPAGYRLSYGGEADARGDAVGNLLSTVGVLLILMTATLVMSFNSFGLAALIASVAVFAVGLAVLALWLFNSVFGFTAILGTLGLIGLAINDSIVVLAALREDPLASQGDRRATQAVVLKATRHVVATTLTTITGFIPLLLDTTGFWPPLAIAIAGGLGGATLLALYYVPAAHLLIYRRQRVRVTPPASQEVLQHV